MPTKKKKENMEPITVDNWRMSYETLTGTILGIPFTIPEITPVYDPPQEGSTVSDGRRFYRLGTPKQ